MYDRSELETSITDCFLLRWFVDPSSHLPDANPEVADRVQEAPITDGLLQRWFASSPDLPDADTEVADKVLAYVDARFARMKYILGLAIDFTVLAQQVASNDEGFKPLGKDEGEAELFQRYPLVEKRGKTQANTLTVKVQDNTFGIRKIEELVVDAFHKMDRSDFPSAYVYNTGQWAKYQDLLCLAFQLSEAGRLSLISRLFDYGLGKMERNVFFFQPTVRPRVFDEVIGSYPRSSTGENGGLTLQALSYGWCTMMFPHLQISADKVRTGSKRQRRFGDIDGYLSLTLELSVEVKDMPIVTDNYERQIRQFAGLAGSNGIHALVIAEQFGDATLAMLEKDGLIGIDLRELQRSCSVWDWPRQDGALQSMLHYLAHIEQNPGAVKRLLTFIRDLDGTHPSLAYADA